jgi:CHAD domain-containing protein
LTPAFRRRKDCTGNVTHYHPLKLSSEEATALRALASGNHAAKARRARLILRSAEGVPQAAIAAEVGLSERQVRRWQRAFALNRMAIFAVQPAEEAETALALPGSPSPAPDQPRRPLRLLKSPGLTPDLPMSEAGRKVLHFHFERMLLHEPGSRLGEDIEAVHDMRVATRRMRSAFVIFEAFYRPRVVRPLIRDLRQAGRILGAVRDTDVFLEKLDHYRQTLPESEQGGIAPLVNAWHERREAAHAVLIAYLDGPDFTRFVEEFEAFLTTAGAGARKIDPAMPGAYLVRHVVPRLLYERYEAVRAYEPILDRAPIETLHALRIDCKRLRYALEFFLEVLGPETKKVIEEVKAIQDHLGDLHDAQVAGDLLRTFIGEYEQAQAATSLIERGSIEGVAQYMASRFAEKHRLLVTFPDAWARFTRPEVRRDLALAVSVL